VGGLRKTSQSIVIDSSNLTLDGSVEALYQRVQGK
jgi:hypothetical protein